jgi:asparaginyl-tRNA synthetase
MGWIKARRDTKDHIFLDIVDSTGQIQAVLNKGLIKASDEDYFELTPEASIVLTGEKRLSNANGYEVHVSDFHVPGPVRIDLQPRPRSYSEFFNGNHIDHILKNRHLYLRNEKQAAVLRFKSFFLFEVHRYLNERGFVFIDAPVLTQLPLYDDSTAFKVEYRDGRRRTHDVYLSQCCTFQLEAAIHAFERVYNVTPSFRAEHSKSNRHLKEYWHLKIEIAWAQLDDLIKFAEELLHTVAKRAVGKAERELDILGLSPGLEEMAPPFETVSYERAVQIVNDSGRAFEWGRSLGIEEEKILTAEFNERPLWVRGIPCSAEAFPFARETANPKITRTCDLICPNGYGEILGTAEKITNKSELLERMAEKGKVGEKQLERYRWYMDLRDYGIVPHGGIGVGIERVIRYLLRLPHVRYATSFPRVCGRVPNP